MKIDELSPTTTNSNRLSYNGKELDKDLNWYHYGARFYDPAVGRWWVVDAADQYHAPYIYVGNNPINFLDKDGNWGDPVLFWLIAKELSKMIGNSFRKALNIQNNKGYDFDSSNIEFEQHKLFEQRAVEKLSDDVVNEFVHMKPYVGITYGRVSSSIDGSFNAGLFLTEEGLYGNISADRTISYGFGGAFSGIGLHIGVIGGEKSLPGWGYSFTAGESMLGFEYGGSISGDNPFSSEATLNDTWSFGYNLSTNLLFGSLSYGYTIELIRF